ncbi:MAG: AMP-binding protein, partial [Xanthomonadaceae bacterium]|nr:AMP-binding protein [Xanthomonadaceae bacterium]
MLSKEALSQLTPEQFRALRRAQQPNPPISMVPRDGNRLPLSFAQQRLWFLSQTQAGSAAYHIRLPLRLQGSLDSASLRGSLDALVSRHESLRTRFEAVEGEAYQKIDPPQPFALREQDLSGLDASAREAALDTVLTEETRRPFDLQRGPLIRGLLVRLDIDDHVLVLTMHHIVSDGWSMGVLARELSALYTAHRRGEGDPLPPLPIQYADYAAWQRERLQGERLEKEATYWRETLRGAPALLELPTDRPRPAEQDYRGGLVGVELDPDLTASLKALGLRTGTTLFMLMLTAWSVVMSRLSGQGEVVIGTPVANRSRSEIAGLIGFFVNTLALRVDLSDGPTVAQALERVKTLSLTAQEHQELPFEQVVEQANPVRSLSYGPLFQVMFAWQDIEADDFDFSDLRCGRASLPHNASKFDLTLNLGERDGCIVGVVEYASALFDRETVERYLGYLRETLRGMAANSDASDARALELPMCGEGERKRLLDGGFRAVDYGDEQCLHRSFKAQAKRDPDAIALRWNGLEIDYAELNRRANRVAHTLLGMGIGAESVVALFMDRGIDLMVGLLGVLKAGAAYLPIDPSSPPPRLRQILDDSAPFATLTDTSLRAALTEATCPVLCMDEARDFAAASEQNPETVVSRSDRLAYVIYTSGSTGVPKGAMIEHRSAHNLWRSLRDESFPNDAPARLRVAMNAPLFFDASVQAWLQWLSGDSVTIVPQDVRVDPSAMLAFLEREAIDVFDCTPMQLAALVDAGLLNRASLRELTVLVGGESVTATLWARLADAEIGRYFNVYGPTECTVDATIQRIGAGDGQRRLRPNIGRPLPNVYVRILDGARGIVPVGAVGELYIGGIGVGRGYLHRPALTAERYIDDPFRPGERLYRTGD